MTYVVWLTPSESTFDILVNGRNPNSIESHPLDVIELIDDSSPIPTAVSSDTFVTLSIVTIRKSESVRQESKQS